MGQGDLASKSILFLEISLRVREASLPLTDGLGTGALNMRHA
jgi:hypothetical protein